MILSGIIVNVVAGFLVNRVHGLTIILVGLLGSIVSGEAFLN